MSHLTSSSIELQTLSVENLKTLTEKDSIYESEVRHFEKIKSEESLLTNGKHHFETKLDRQTSKSGHVNNHDLNSMKGRLQHFHFNGNGHHKTNGNDFSNLTRYDSIVSSGYGSVADIDSPAKLEDWVSLHKKFADEIEIDSDTPSQSLEELSQTSSTSSLSNPSTEGPYVTPLTSANVHQAKIEEKKEIKAAQVKKAPGDKWEVNKKNSEYIRIVERFGLGLKDPCLFPLALPMDGSDVYKGVSTYESLLLLSDCILFQWEEALRKNQARRKSQGINSVLPNAAKYMCPMIDLDGHLLCHPDLKPPLKRHNSQLNLTIIDKVNKNVKKTRDDIHVNPSTTKGAVLVRPRALSCNPINGLQSSDNFLATSKYRKSLTHRSSRAESIVKCFIDAEKVASNRSAAPQTGPRIPQPIPSTSHPDARTLVRSIRIENPISLALQITKLERQLILELPSEEVMQIVLKRSSGKASTPHLTRLLEFGKQLALFVVDIIERERTAEEKGRKIAAIIEVACVLRKLRNWQSLSSIVKGLQSPRIYSLSAAWQFTKNRYAVHFNDYLKLIRIVHLNDVSILRSQQPHIPSIKSLFRMLSIRCLATWDRLENQPRWTEAPSLVTWLERAMLDEMLRRQLQNMKIDWRVVLASESKKKNKKKDKDITQFVDDELMAIKRQTHLDRCLQDLSADRCSFLPHNDPIYFIQNWQLPATWTQRSVRNIPSQWEGRINRTFLNAFAIDMANLKKYDLTGH